MDLPESEPRYRGVWKGIEHSMRDPRRFGQVMRLFSLARLGGKPSPAQIDLLLKGLDSDALAGRALSDYLLRRFYAGGPAFDPAWTGQNHVRAVAAWRRYIGRSTR